MEGKKPKVLIVEDDSFLRGVIAQKLVREGFDVEAAIDSIEAFESMKSKKPEIILLDLILPGMDGFEILSQLKKTPDSGDIPVMILSNLGQEEDKRRAMDLGAVEYFVKSDHTPDEIVQRIRAILGKEYL